VNKVLKCVLSGIVVAVVALAAPVIDPKFDFSQAKAGSELTITGTGFPSSATGIVLTIQPRGVLVPASSATSTALVFTLPALDAGEYTATLTFPAEGAPTAPVVPLAGKLTVLKPPSAQTPAQPPATTASDAPPKITFVAPPTAYGDDKDLFAFDIYGENFPDPAVGSYVLSVSSRMISPIELKSNQPCSPDTPCLKWIGPEHIAISGIKRADNYQWTTPVDLRINGKWVGAKTLIFSRWQRHWPFLAAGGVIVLSFLIIMGVFRRKIAAHGGGHDVITLFLLDADTNTYSLSKFQVFTWLTITVFAYVYVLFCGITIQGVMKWPEFPGTLAGMFGLSLGAAVAASAVTETKGNKGAGPNGPSFADFFSSGGVVAADRFQFFLWTLVGFAGYLSLLWFSDPTTIKEVPTVPEGLLYLMGISAGGYVGGKLARQPGPNITGLKASLELPASALHLRILGDNLSPNGTFQIQGMGVNTVKRPVTIISQAQGKTDFATEMEIVITTPDASWIARGPHTLRLINDDGQFAEKDYSIGSTVTGAVTIGAAAGGAAITIPTLALAPGIATVDLEVHDSAGSVFKLPAFSPVAPPAPTVLNVAGANPAGPATLLVTVSDGSSIKMTIP
jgi:IPT/TIG domain